MSKLNLDSRVPAQYDKATFADLFRAITNVVNPLAESRVAARYNARASVPAGVTESHAVSDFVPDSNATVSSGTVRLGWVCNVAGSPGTFQEARALTGALSHVQRVYTEYATNTDLTTVIPIDDSIPQSGEGTEVLTAAITPKSASNRLRIRFESYGSAATAAAHVSAALFVDSTADALTAAATTVNGANDFVRLGFEYETSAASTSARTYKVRVGPSSGTMRLNGNTGARFFGGVSRATLVVDEIA